jgi:uncharacterized membrane protein YdjX (TVP38/TMEM64 family)
MVAILVALAAVWSLTPLSRLFDPSVLATYEQQVRAWPLAPLAVVAILVLAGLIATPGTLLIGATVLLFGAWPGALYALVGMVANAIVVYAIGRFAARETVDQWVARHADSRLGQINRRLARRGLLAIALIRLTPIPYSLVNLVAGASRIGFADFVLGTAIGLLPAIALLAGVAAEFEKWLANPAWGGLFALIGVGLVVLALALSLRRWAVRRSER